ncbi:MAG: aminotransferase class V-fold PLP-dependent enzyme [Opitutaceae bacterium]|nr:aminotransferase class V-fold PLP-dependent enzyme [Opitutaceae bacterium]
MARSQSTNLNAERVALNRKVNGLAVYPRRIEHPALWSSAPTSPGPSRTRDRAVRRLVHSSAQHQGAPGFLILHGSLLPAGWESFLAGLGVALVVIEDLVLPGARPDACAQVFGRQPPPPDVHFLLLNPRDAQGAVLDEMDCFERWAGCHGNLHWAWGESRADCLAALRKTWRTVQHRRAGHPAALPRTMLGADWLGVKETLNLRQVVRRKTLFRHYGIDHPRSSEDLENLLRRRSGAPFAVAVSSGSAALNCAIAALGAQPGDEVIVPAFSWFSCYNAILHFGLTPVFAEIDATLNLDPADFARRITPRTKAVIVVHYQGGPARLGDILRTARRHGLRVIEDCAQALGSRYEGQPLGTLGDIGILSFQANKIISSGEGGALLCQDQVLFERAVRYHDLGIIRPVFLKQTQGTALTAPFPGNQYRMSEITATVALVQLTRLPWLIRRCRRHTQRLRALLGRACPRLGFRPTGDAAGDSQITLFIDWGERARAAAATAMLLADGIQVGPSSGMTNLLEADYVRSRSCIHGVKTPDWPPAPPAPADFPATQEWLQRYTPLAMGPRFIDTDVDRIGASVIQAYRKVSW